MGLMALPWLSKGWRARPCCVRASTLLAVVTSVLYTLVYALFGQQLVNLFTDLEEVRQIAYDHLPWLIASPLISVWCFQFDGIFIGAQRTRDMRNMMVLSFAIYIAVLYGALPLWGNHAIWAALLAFFMVIRFPEWTGWWDSKAVVAGLGLVIFAPGLSAMMQLKASADANFLLVTLFFLIWGADVGAYFAG